MWTDLSNWWQYLWSDPTIIRGTVAGFISSAIMFLIGEMLWKSRVERVRDRIEFQKERLNKFYAPLYMFYKKAYMRYEAWKKEHLDSHLTLQPFFEDDQSETFAENILSEHPGYASLSILGIWSDFQASSDKHIRNKLRNKMVAALIREYHELRRELKLDYDTYELKSGAFKNIVDESSRSLRSES